MAQLAELKAETEAALEQIQEERHYIAILMKELKNQQAQTENATSDFTTQTEQQVQMPTTGRVVKRSSSWADQPEESDKLGKEIADQKHAEEANKPERETTVVEVEVTKTQKRGRRQ